MKKYKFTGKTKIHLGKTLRQIVCVTAFGAVSAGDVGGWIESESNLSHHGNAWVYGNGMVYGNGIVCGNGMVCDNGIVYDNGMVCDNGMVYGNGRVCDNGRVYGNGRVCGNGEVLTRKAIILSSLTYHVTITDTHITIGYQNHKKEYWEKVTSEEIKIIDCDKSALLWEKYGEFILMLAKEEF